MKPTLVFKIVPRADWEGAESEYCGSEDDRTSGFLHFSTASQLGETLRRHYAGRDGLVLVAVAQTELGPALKWEQVPSRGEEFPHLYGVLPKSAALWTRPLARNARGDFLLPEMALSP